MHLKFSLVSLLVFAAIATAARADVLVSGTAGGGTQSFTLDLTIVTNAVAGFDITSASGTVDGIAISLLPNPTPGAVSTSPLGAFYFDNIVYTTGNPFDYWGVLLTYPTNPTPNEINIFYNDSTAGSGELYTYTVAGGYTSASIDTDPGPSVSATPEPSSLVLLGTGILAAAGVVRRRMKGTV